MLPQSVRDPLFANLHYADRCNAAVKHAFITKPTDAIRPTSYCREMIEHEADLTIPGLILVALMSGGE